MTTIPVGVQYHAVGANAGSGVAMARRRRTIVLFKLAPS